MAYGIPERAAMIALMALNKETPNAELKHRYGIDVRKSTRLKLNGAGLLQSRNLGRKGFAHELTDAGWAWAVAELDEGVPPRAGSAGGALYALLNGLKAALDARGMLLQELFAPPPDSETCRLAPGAGFGRPTAASRPGLGTGWSCAISGRSLGDWPRREVDQEIVRMFREKDVNLTLHEDRGRLTRSRSGRGPSPRRGRHAPDQHGVRAVDAELKALGQVGFSTFHTAKDIWRDDGIHVDGIHTWAFDRVLENSRPGARRRRRRQPRHSGAARNRQVALPGTRPARGDRAGAGLRSLSAE